MRRTFLAAAGVGAMILLSHGPAAKAAEVKTIAAAVLTAVFKELGPQFERDTGHKLVTRFAATSVVKREIDAGETFDLTISSTSGIDDWIKEGKIVAPTRTAVAYAGLGVGYAQAHRSPTSVRSRRLNVRCSMRNQLHMARRARAPLTLTVRLDASELPRR